MLSPTKHPVLPEPTAQPVGPGVPLIDRPSLAIAYLLAGGLLEICGPFFWAVLVGGFLLAEFALD